MLYMVTFTINIPPFLDIYQHHGSYGQWNIMIFTDFHRFPPFNDHFGPADDFGTLRMLRFLSRHPLTRLEDQLGTG